MNGADLALWPTARELPAWLAARHADLETFAAVCFGRVDYETTNHERDFWRDQASTFEARALAIAEEFSHA